MEERELSIVFSVPVTLYTRLFLTLSEANYDYYTKPRQLIKNIFQQKHTEETSTTTTTSKSGKQKIVQQLRTIQTEHGFVTQQKQILNEMQYRSLYRNVNRETQLTLLLSVIDRVSLEKPCTLDETKITGYTQIIRDYVYCRKNGLRIAVERHFHDYIDPVPYKMSYDCFNRYKFDCSIHIEWEYDTNTNIDDIISTSNQQTATNTDKYGQLNNLQRHCTFINNLCTDEIVYALFMIMSQKNLNNIGDEIININNMALIHKYGYSNYNNLQKRKFKFFSLKYDGERHNFCIFGKYLQINRQILEFKNHWFGQAIIGHCEILATGQIIIIDVYLVAENFYKIAQKYNLSYTGALQSYHQFYNRGAKGTTTNAQTKKEQMTTLKRYDGGEICGDVNSSSPLKTQDEYFHMKRLRTQVNFIRPLDAINCIELLRLIWRTEPDIAAAIQLQKFHLKVRKLHKAFRRCTLPIDGCLAFTYNRIYKIKQNPTIDLLWKFDEMFRSIYKRMKANNHDLKKIITIITIQKSLNWLEFERRYPGRFEKFALEFLFFAENRNFSQHYKGWSVHIDLELFLYQLNHQDSTAAVLLAEFEVCHREHRLVFVRLRTDKFSANSMHVFINILKQK